MGHYIVRPKVVATRDGPKFQADFPVEGTREPCPSEDLIATLAAALRGKPLCLVPPEDVLTFASPTSASSLPVFSCFAELHP
eukprot:7383149-Prymnesium_polylepis.2